MNPKYQSSCQGCKLGSKVIGVLRLVCRQLTATLVSSFYDTCKENGRLIEFDALLNEDRP
jgi:hypothetical protein